MGWLARCRLEVLTIPLLICAASVSFPSEAAEPRPEQLEELRSARAVQVLVVTTGDVADLRPILIDMTGRLLRYAHVHLARPSTAADVRLTITVDGKGIARAYDLPSPRRVVTGATVSGTIALDVRGTSVYSRSFSRTVDPPMIVIGPLGSPFEDALAEPFIFSGESHDFLSRMMALVADVYGTVAIITALSDPAPKMRWTAAEILGRRRESKAMEALNKARSDENETVRKKAAWALEQISEPQRK